MALPVGKLIFASGLVESVHSASGPPCLDGQGFKQLIGTLDDLQNKVGKDGIEQY